jgi:methionyl-tRNA formyltransferase
VTARESDDYCVIFAATRGEGNASAHCDPTMNELGLYLMSQKGLSVLAALLNDPVRSRIRFVVVARDSAVKRDYFEEIAALAGQAGIACHDRRHMSKHDDCVGVMIAVSWRWLIPALPHQRLVVLHDSLLPRYRGFAPLVNALVQGDPQVGVTAVLARRDSDYDSGPVLLQRRLPIVYPATISDTIDRICTVYCDVALEVARLSALGELVGTDQDESQVTYSPWLDESDYLIDWTQAAGTVRRFVDATGSPYRGAASYLDGRLVRITHCEEYPGPFRLERPAPGKVMLIQAGCPCVACGDGAVRILSAHYDDSDEDALPLKHLRVRFSDRPR